MGKWIKTIFILIGLNILTHWIPFSGFFRNLDTMIHEFGHAVVTLLVSGQVHRIELYADHSGVTRSMLDQTWALIPVGLAGYMTASLFAWLLFALYSRNKQAAGLVIITLLAAASLLLFVRNSFGMLWLAGFIVLNILVLLFGGKFGRYYYLFIAFLTLEESVFGPLTLMLRAVTEPSRAGDASLLAESTGFPALIWALIFLFIALWSAKQAISTFSRRKSYPTGGSSLREREGNYYG